MKVDYILGCSNVSLDQPGASGSRSGMSAPVNILTNKCNYPSRVGKNKQTGRGWYARLSDDKKAEHLQRLRIARQEKKEATRKDADMSQRSAAYFPSSPAIPLSNVTNRLTNGK
jgi:uncharacterized membrane protein